MVDTLYLVLTLFLCLVGIYFIYWEIELFFNHKAPFVGTPKKVINQVVKIMDLKQTSVLYDLGCGDLRIILNAIKQYQSIKAVGIDNSLSAFIASNINYLLSGNPKNVSILKSDYYKVDIPDATHIFAWATVPGITKLYLKLITDKYSSPEVTLFSLDFKVNGVTPDQSYVLGKGNNRFGHSLYKYFIKRNSTDS